MAVTAAPVQQRDAIWTPAQGGCWIDNANGQRALDKGLGGFNDMTPAKCQSLCDAQGFSLAGVEYGRECFCGNTIFGNNRPSSAGICNMTCSGDAGQTCGGPDAINIYIKDNFSYTTGPATTLGSYNGFSNPRCWHDSASSRIFTGHPSTTIQADQMTVQKCIDGCAAAGFISAGLEFGRECYCGNTEIPAGDRAFIDECNMPCLGDASQYCGAADRLLIYNKPTNIPEPTPNGQWTPASGGCWTDNVDQQRALQHLAGRFDDLTPGKCQVLCENAGFPLAGVEYSRECWCGNTITGNNRVSYDGICYMPCSGNAAKACGGSDAINIYVKDNFQYTVGPASVLSGYNGFSTTQCWQDMTNNRLLKHAPASPISGDSMTVQKCLDGCMAAGYSSAGVEFGRECYCGNVNYPPGQSESMSECNMPCTGNASQICGGPDRVLIYFNPGLTVSRNGIILISNANTNAFVGYLAKSTTSDGKATVDTDIANAETVSFQVLSGAWTASERELMRANGPSGFPFLGFVPAPTNTGSTTDIDGESANSLFLVNTGHTGPAALPTPGSNAYTANTGVSRSIESSVWYIDVNHDRSYAPMEPRWINSNGGAPPTNLYVLGNALYATGDLVALNNASPNNYFPVAFTILYNF